MAIKASILVTTYRKNDVLPNVFHSISRQETDFEWEVCVLDDCSPIDPKPLFDEHLKVKNKKYVRLITHMSDFITRANFPHYPNVTSSYGYNLLETSPESEVVVVQNADVIWTRPDMLQRFVDGMRPGEVQFCRVTNIPVDPLLYVDWDTGIEKVRANAEASDSDYQGYGRGRNRETGERIRPNHPSQWYPFLTPFYRADLLDVKKLNFLSSCLDTKMSGRLRGQNYEAVWLKDVLGVHQRHASIQKTVMLDEKCLRHWQPHTVPERQVYE